MRGRTKISYTLLGAGVLMIALSMILLAGSVAAQQETEGPPNLGAQYIGSGLCAMCHNAGDPPLWDTWQRTFHAQTVLSVETAPPPGDFSDTEALTIHWPDGETRPVTLADIQYVMNGQYVNQYVTVITQEDGTVGYYVLPVVWNLPQSEGQEGMWTTTDGDTWFAPENDWRTTCAGCHTTGWTPDAGTNFGMVGNTQRGDIEMGVQCESCHGPASKHTATRDFPTTMGDPQICAQCHSRGTDPSGQYPFPIGYQTGLELDESMFILAGLDDETVWWGTGHAQANNAQYNEWLRSSHATAYDTLMASDQAEDSCLRCHAAPADMTIDRAENTLDQPQYGVTCVACHTPHPATLNGNGEAEAPYLLAEADTYKLCVSCHNSTTPDGEVLIVNGSRHHPVQEMYEGKQIVDQVAGIPGGHSLSNDGPGCVDCHMPQTAAIGVLGGGVASHTLDVSLPADSAQASSCRTCHTDLGARYLRQFVDGIKGRTSNRMARIQDTLDNNPAKSAEWITTILAFVEGDGSWGVHNYAYTDALLYAVELDLGLIVSMGTTSSGGNIYTQAKDPVTCAECHRNEMQQWQGSVHAVTSLNQNFLKEFASMGRPAYCMSCHASGYNPDTGEYAFEGVICSRCHIETTQVEHPPAPVDSGAASDVCGQCHSGAHAPTYDEWLVSGHRFAGVDCVDCHMPHTNGLILGDVNATCGDCHEEATTDEIHMGEDMTCVDCHMTYRVADSSGHVLATGHTMAISPGVCASCHGNTHLLSARDYARSPEDAAAVANLEAEIERLETANQDRRYSSIIGGALGAAVMLFVLYLLWRLRAFL